MEDKRVLANCPAYADMPLGGSWRKVGELCLNEITGDNYGYQCCAH